MTRVQVSDVRDVGGFQDVEDSIIQAHIDDANSIVNERVQGYVEDQLLDLVEKRLAAHRVAIHPDGRTVSTDAVGNAELSYEGTSEMGYKSTRHGQQLLQLVPTAILAGSQGGKYVSTTHAGEDRDSLEERDHKEI